MLGILVIIGFAVESSTKLRCRTKTELVDIRGRTPPPVPQACKGARTFPSKGAVVYPYDRSFGGPALVGRKVEGPDRSRWVPGDRSSTPLVEERERPSQPLGFLPDRAVN